MFGRGRLLALLMVATVIVAGCAGDGGKTTTAKTSDGLIVAGRVIDDQQLPVAGASVVLSHRKDNAVVTETNSSDAGEFSFGKVPVGLYILNVRSASFEPFTRNVDVIDGRESQLGAMIVILTALPIIEPFHETLTKTLSVQYGIAYQINGDFNQGCLQPSFTCNAITYPPPNTFFDSRDPKQTPWAGVVFEESWTSTSPVCAKGVAVDIYNPDAPNNQDPNRTNPHYWTNYPSSKWQLTSPIRIVIPRNETDNADALDADWRIAANGGKMLARGNWTVRNFPPGKGLTNLVADLNCFTDQKFDLFWTNFYLQPPTIDFSARPQ